MKKAATAATVLALAGALLSPASAIPSERTVTEPYSMPSGYGHYVTITAEGNWAIFEPRAGERRVTFSIQDELGGPVLGKVFFWEGDRWAEREPKFCGATKKPLRVKPSETVYVGAFFGDCNGAQSVATTGTVTATFSK